MADLKIAQLAATNLALADEVEIYRPGAPTSELRAPLPVPTYQAVTRVAAEQVPNGFVINRTSSNIRVELTEDLQAGGVFTLPSAPVEGDVVEVVRNAGGFFDWTNALTSTTLGYRERYAKFLYSGGTWKKIVLRGRAGIRRESTATRALAPDDSGATIVTTAACDYTLPDTVGSSTGFEVTIEQRGPSAYATLLPGAGLTRVGSSTLQTTYDGDALIVKAIGSSQVLVYHRAVETAPLETSSTAFGTATSAGRPRLSTATAPVNFSLDFNVLEGASGTLISGPQPVNVVCATDVEYGQAGDDFLDFGAQLSTSNFAVLGVMTWTLVKIGPAPDFIKRYLILGQTSLAFTDPIDLAGDVTGVLPEVHGGTGGTSLAANPTFAALTTTANNALPKAGGTVTGPVNFAGRVTTNEQVPANVTRLLPTTVQSSDNGKVFIYSAGGVLTVPPTATLVPNPNEIFMAPLFNVSTTTALTIRGTVSAATVDKVIPANETALIFGLNGSRMRVVYQGVMTIIAELA
jgi:hypothetical protein